MSASIRGGELFAGEDWTVLYSAFTAINFNASDPPTINKALRAYIQQTYPESFNDWIESSEFVMLLDLLSWLAGTLAFKTDINARENFIETAQARESILRLARFLSYNPSRNQAARGLLKIMAVQTDDDVIDGYGVNLNGVTVQWNNPDDPDWQERFTLVLNNAFTTNNQFGQPLKSGTVSSIATQLYRINTSGNVVFPFSASTAGSSTSFEICDADFDDGGGYYEDIPDYNSAFNLYYLNDSQGFDSGNTGFCMLFKQGSLQKSTYSINVPIENQVIDINVTGINNTDVWVETLDDSGNVTTYWTQVPAIFGENITYNSISPTIQNIFSVITRDNDQISIRFADGRFGAAPVGNIRIWYRTSNGLNYQIRPTDIDSVQIPIPYLNAAGVPHTLYVTVSLQNTVSNSAPRETDDQIRLRAPSVHGSQNRMVSGQDYNTFPLQSNIAAKMKAVNRVYSGHSRFIDLNDPTGTYQDTNVYSDDGIFYKERNDNYVAVPLSLNRTAAEMVSTYVQPALNRRETINYAQDVLINNLIALPPGVTWQAVTASQFNTSGYINGVTQDTDIRALASLQVQINNLTQWVTISSVSGALSVAPIAGYPGPVVLDYAIPSGTPLLAVLPQYNPTLDGDTAEALQQCFSNNQSFTLSYNWSLGTWAVGPAYTSTMVAVNAPLMLLMTVDYLSGGMWQITTYGERYVYESENNIQWYFGGDTVVDAATGLAQQDTIRIMRTNVDYSAAGYDGNGNLKNVGLAGDYMLSVDKMILYADGYADPVRISVMFQDSNADGQPDYPDTFLRVVSENNSQFLFYTLDSTNYFDPFYSTVVYAQEADRINASPAIGTVAYQITGLTPLTSSTFWVMGTSGWAQDFTNYKCVVGRGPNTAATWVKAGGALDTTINPTALDFQWKHYATPDHRIDPSKTNIVDIFVLTSQYDYLVRQWIAAGANSLLEPTSPTELDLRIAFETFEDYKMFSDEIVWRPVAYKYLFGQAADPELQVQFKVVTLPNAPLSDGEIKSRIITAINAYFAVNLWDFGETFYFTELAAYIHQQLATNISSFVIVPINQNSSFGDGFEVSCLSNQLLISTAQVDDIVIITSNTAANLRIR